MVAWTDLPQYKNPACKFAGSCRKFYPATPLLRPWVSTISTDVFGIQHFDSDSSAQPSTGKAAFADLANARKGRQMGKIQFTNNFLTHRVPFMLSPGRSLHLGQKSASNPPVAAPKKIRHATGPLFLPGPQNRRPTNSSYSGSDLGFGFDRTLGLDFGDKSDRVTSNDHQSPFVTRVGDSGGFPRFGGIPAVPPLIPAPIVPASSRNNESMGCREPQLSSSPQRDSALGLIARFNTSTGEW
ncbi:hypothetical protein R3P38DRAFT_3298121 [Favolaschia claudopus]|uniref:Uncharacterized protein n=1 Tax=Favolaschia claudopus TaxID=2862362 RepID=A0AAV9Z3T5_9AGAR